MRRQAHLGSLGIRPAHRHLKGAGSGAEPHANLSFIAPSSRPPLPDDRAIRTVHFGGGRWVRYVPTRDGGCLLLDEGTALRRLPPRGTCAHEALLRAFGSARAPGGLIAHLSRVYLGQVGADDPAS